MIFLGQATYNWRLCTFTPWCKEDRAFPQMISLADSWILTPPREWWSGAGGQCLTQICFLQNFGYWFQALFSGLVVHTWADQVSSKHSRNCWTTWPKITLQEVVAKQNKRLIPAMVRYCGGEVVEMVARSDLLGTSSVWTFIWVCSTKNIGFEWSVNEYFRQ